MQNDIESLDDEKKANETSNLGYKYILELSTLQLNSIQKTYTEVYFSIYSHGPKIYIGNSEGFKSSGKIGYIEKEKLKHKLLKYYKFTTLV